MLATVVWKLETLGNVPGEMCVICRERPSNKSFLDGCFHMFCFQCIMEWAKLKNECPLCKRTFESVYHSVHSIKDYCRLFVQSEVPAGKKWWQWSDSAEEGQGSLMGSDYSILRAALLGLRPALQGPPTPQPIQGIAGHGANRVVLDPQVPWDMLDVACQLYPAADNPLLELLTHDPSLRPRAQPLLEAMGLCQPAPLISASSIEGQGDDTSGLSQQVFGPGPSSRTGHETLPSERPPVHPGSSSHMTRPTSLAVGTVPLQRRHEADTAMIIGTPEEHDAMVIGSPESETAPDRGAPTRDM